MRLIVAVSLRSIDSETLALFVGGTLVVILGVAERVSESENERVRSAVIVAVRLRL